MTSLLKYFPKDNNDNDINKLPRIKFSPWGSESQAGMNSPITLEEVKTTLLDMAPYKALGFDGFHLGF